MDGIGCEVLPASRVCISADLTVSARLQAIANKLVRLREALPNTDISKLVARSPAVLLELDPAVVAARLSELRCAALWHSKALMTVRQGSSRLPHACLVCSAAVAVIC